MQFRCSRRYFLKLAAGATVGVAATRLEHVLQSTAPLRVGLVGLGDRGLRHLEFAAKSSAFRVTDICDSAKNTLLHVADTLDPGVRTWTDYRGLLSGGSHEVLVVCVPYDQQSKLLRLSSSKGTPIYLDPGTPHEMPSNQGVAPADMVSLHLTNRITSPSQRAVAYSRKARGSILITSRHRGHSLLPTFDTVDLLAQMLPPAPEWARLRVSRLNQPWGNDYELSIDRHFSTVSAYLKAKPFQSSLHATEIHFYSKARQFHATLPAHGDSEALNLHGDLWARFAAAVRARDSRMLPIPVRSFGLSAMIMSAFFQASAQGKAEWIFS